MRMTPQWEMFDHPEYLPSRDKPLVQHWLRREDMALAGRALEVAELHHHQLGLGVPLVGVPRHRIPWAFWIGRQALGCGPKRQLWLLRLGGLGFFVLGWLLAGQ